MRRPKVLAFDVVGTLFSLDSMVDAFDRIDLPPEALDLWFAETLRDGFALTCAGVYRSFRETAAGRLSVMLRRYNIEPSELVVNPVLEVMSNLQVFGDVRGPLHDLFHSGFRLVLLTNGDVETAGRLASLAGINDFAEQIVSIDEVGRWKPHPAAYRYVLSVIDCDPDEAILISSHDWDIMGAAEIGMSTCWLNRAGDDFSTAMASADMTSNTMAEVAERIMGLPFAEAA